MFRRDATSVFALAACVAGVISGATPGETQSASGGNSQGAGTQIAGIFVSIGVDQAGTLITIDRGGSLTAFRVETSATVTEVETGTTARPAMLTSLKPGEPVALQLGADGAVASIAGTYGTVATRVIASQNGYIVAANGNAYKLVGAALAAASSLTIGTYVLLRTDASTGNAFDVTASRQPFLGTATQGAAVAVTFVVHVPANTPPSDAIYLATNAGNWTPNGTRLAPLSGGRWSATLQLAPGTQIEYRYTRGSWATDERTAAGTPVANRSLTVAKSAGTQSVDDVVARWADLAS
jgi:hypothetical protein